MPNRNFGFPMPAYGVQNGATLNWGNNLDQGSNYGYPLPPVPQPLPPVQNQFMAPVPSSQGPAAPPIDPVNPDPEVQQRGIMGTLFNSDGTFNMDNLANLSRTIGGFGSLALGFQQNRQAADALRFQKQAYKTNLANQISSYNMALEDRAKARAAQTGAGDASAEEYIRKHRLGS